MKKQKKGFTLIQAVISIVIISLCLSAVVSLLGTVIKQTTHNQKRLLATYLTQECIELSRNIRDSNWKQNFKWDCSFPENTPFSIEPTNNQNINTTDCKKGLGVKIITNNNFSLYKKDNRFTHNSQGTPTIFTRNAVFTKNNSEQGSITCTTSFDEEEVSITHILTDWNKK